MNLLPTPMAAGSTPAGWFGVWNRTSGLNLTVGMDATGPVSAPAELTTHFPPGLAGGTSPNATVNGWSNTPRTANSDQYQALYLSLWLKIEGTQFYMNNNGVKLSYFGVGRAPGTTAANESILILEGMGSQHYYDTAFKLHFTNLNDPFIYQKASTGRLVTVGTWHQIEVWQAVNTVGVADGQLKVWVDGTNVIDRSNITWRAAGQTAGYYSWRWEPTWGGGLTSHLGDDYISIDHVYLSGLP